GAQYIAGLEPDLLGEAMVWRVLSKDGSSAGPYFDRVFERAERHAVRTGFAVLGRLSEDHKEAEGWIARVLEAYWPFFLAHPAAFARDTADALANLLGLLEALGRPVSPELLERRAAVAAQLGG